MKQSIRNQKGKGIQGTVLILVLSMLLGLLTACKGDENVTSNSSTSMIGQGEEISLEFDPIEEFKNTYIRPREEDLQVSQIGNYKVGDVELGDAVSMPETVDCTWMGYSEVDLGFLTPEEMPNCEMTEYGFHTVMYDGVLYFYINEYNKATGDPAFQEFADVWGTKNAEGDVFILGGLEEYGRYCAKKGEDAE